MPAADPQVHLFGHAAAQVQVHGIIKITTDKVTDQLLVAAAVLDTFKRVR
jgi:hypothetical protein